MEVCGGQTHTLMRSGIDRMLPESIALVHGPGCPVCVTPLELIDQALAIAAAAGGDLHLVRRHAAGARLDHRPAGGQVRGRRRAHGLFAARRGEAGAREPRPRGGLLRGRIRDHRAAPTPWRSGRPQRLGLGNFSILVSHVLVPPAMEAILASPDCRVQGFLAAGHVCAVMGYWEYEPIAERYRVPIVVTGFEPLDLLQGIHMAVKALEAGRCGVENQYVRAVTRDGNPAGAEAGGGGLRGLRPQVARHRHDPAERAPAARGVPALTTPSAGSTSPASSPRSRRCASPARSCRGSASPPSARRSGRECTPERPLGAPMVSSEGACSAYYRYARLA